MLPPGCFRGLAAENLIHAGEELDLADLVITGKRERFLSDPGDTALLALIEEARRQNQRDSELEKMLEFLSALKEKEPDLLVKTLFLAGRIESAFQAAKNSRAIGWSYGSRGGGVLFAGILAVLCLESIEEATTIKRVLKR